MEFPVHTFAAVFNARTLARLRTLLPWLIAVWFLSGPVLLAGAWSEPTAGLPLIELVDTKAINPSEDKWMVVQDRLGRLFTSDNQVHMFDGQAWHTFSVPGSYAIRTLLFDEDDRLWVSAFNEVGFFEEKTLGSFVYRSLSAFLPKGGELGHIWASTRVGPSVYFVCNKQVIRWDGEKFQSWPYAGEARLFPFKHANETWFHHLETGLYRITADGPKLEIPASELPDKGIFGLMQDEESLIVVSAAGLYRPGLPLRAAVAETLNRQIRDARVCSFTVMPDGYGCVGTLNNGLFLVGPKGYSRHVGAEADGLPARAVLFLHIDSNNRVRGTAHNSIFSFDATGAITGFDARNGLKGSTVRDVRVVDERIYTVDLAGISELVPSHEAGAHFESRSAPNEYYFRLEPFKRGFMGARFSGVDFISSAGGTERVVQQSARAIFQLHASRRNPDTVFSVGTHTLEKITALPTGGYDVETLASLSDESGSLHEDTAGRLWVGTASKGIFTYTPGTKALVNFQPPTAWPGLGSGSLVASTDRGIFLFLPGIVYVTAPDGSQARRVNETPPLEVKCARTTRDGQAVLVAFSRVGTNDLPSQGLGRLSIDENGATQWTEFDSALWQSVGVMNGLEFSQENSRELLWIAGSNGLARVEFAALKPVNAPPSPFLRGDLDTVAGAALDREFAFHDHRVGFQVFTGDYQRGKDWLFQSRLSSGAWSAPARRNTYEFTNLSEGRYRFEIRAVTPAGLPGEVAAHSFRILPPWYRSGWAYGGYALGALAAGAGIIRVREHRSRARTRQLEALVKLRTQELEKASAAKDEFLAGISHEIRNPMNGVIGIAESFRTETLDADGRHKFGLLRQCANHLSSLLEEILDFSRVQAGVVDLENVAFDPHELVASVAAITASDSERSGIPVEIAISPAVPRAVRGDPRRVRQILLNFVGNALKFAGRGKIEVTVWCKPAVAGQTELIFAVMDEGPGIPLAEQEKVFARFERGAAALATRAPGTGLGLALCKGLAEKMGGRLWLESEPGRGACFYFSAPFPTDPTEPTAVAPGQPPASASRRALVVDDEEYNRIALADLLSALGVSVDTAESGATALTLAAKRTYDVIFLDYHLPGMSGLEIARALRAADHTPSGAPIVATTAFTTAEKRAECIAAGMTTFLAKPVTMGRLRTVLTLLFNPAEIAAPDDAAATQPEEPAAGIRLLAKSKARPYDEELAIFLSELEFEHERLQAAIAREEPGEACACAHTLYGRLAFIGARHAEMHVRKLEAAAATSDWAAAHQLMRELPERLNSLRLTLASPARDVPRA